MSPMFKCSHCGLILCASHKHLHLEAYDYGISFRIVYEENVNCNYCEVENRD